MEYTLTDWFAVIDAAIENASWRSNFWSAHMNAAARDRANRDYKAFHKMREDLVSGAVVITRNVTAETSLVEKCRPLTDTIGRGAKDIDVYHSPTCECVSCSGEMEGI